MVYLCNYRYSTARLDKRVCSTSLYHSKQYCIVLRPCSDRTDYTIDCLSPKSIMLSGPRLARNLLETWGAFHTFYFSEIFRDSRRISKKADAKREFYATSQIFSENTRDSHRNKKCETHLCSLANLWFACVRNSIMIVSLRSKSTMLASQKTEDLI